MREWETAGDSDRQWETAGDNEVKGQTPSIGGIAADLVKNPLYGLRDMNIGVRQALGDVFGSERMKKSAQDEAKEMAYQQKAYSPQFESETAQGLYSGAQSLARQAPGIAAGLATGGATLPLTMMGADVVASGYTKYRGRDATPGMAAVGALGEGIVEIGSEKWPMGFVIKQFGRMGAGKFLAGLLAKEIPTEQANTIIADALDTAIANPDKTWDDYLKERFGRGYQTMLATVSQVGLMAAGSKVAEKVIKRNKVQDTKDKLDTIDVKNADHEEGLKEQSQTTMYVGQDGTASDTLGTKVTEDPAVTELARAQNQNNMEVSPWEPKQPDMFPIQTNATQGLMDIRTEPDRSGLARQEDLTQTRERQDSTYNEGDAGVTSVKSTAASDAQAKAMWYRNEAKKLRNSNEDNREQRAQALEDKATQQDRIFELASKEYKQPTLESDPNLPAPPTNLNVVAAERALENALQLGETLAQQRMQGQPDPAREAKQKTELEELSQKLRQERVAANNALRKSMGMPPVESDPNIPTTFSEIERKGAHLTDEDYRSAMAKMIAKDPDAFSNAEKVKRMDNPRDYLTPPLVQKYLGIKGPASQKKWTRDDLRTLKSWNEQTGEFSGIEALERFINDPKYRGYKLIMKYIVKHMKKQEANGVPMRWALDMHDDGTPRKMSYDRTLKQENYGVAHYDSLNNLIWFGTLGLTAVTMIHEAIHGLTVRLINSNPNDPRVKALDFIYQSVLKDPIFLSSWAPGRKEYGLTNLKEFISEAFSNPRFQLKLLNHQVNGLAGTAKNAMSALAEQVRRMLGIPDHKATNTIEEIIKRIDEVAEEVSSMSPEDQDKYQQKYPAEFKKTPGLRILPVHVKAMEHKAKIAAQMSKWKEEKAKYDEIIKGSIEATNAMDKLVQSDRNVDAEDSKANVIEDVTGIQHVAKDPVVDEALIEKIQKEEDGGKFWAFTPGALARAIAAKSTLVLTGYRLMDNASKRIAYQTKKIIAPVEKTIVKILQSDEKAEILHDLFMRELRNKRDYDPDELRTAEVSEELIMAHLEFRTMMEGVREQQNIALADKGLPPVDKLQSFITSRWSGPWRANIRDADGNIVWQIAEHSRRGANQALKHIMERQPNLKADDILYRQGRERSDSVEAGYNEMLKLVDPDDPRTQALQSIYEEYILGKTENVAQQEKHFLRKTGVRGYAGDRPWSKEDAKDMFVQQFEYAKNAIKWAEYQKAVDKLKPLLHDPSLQESQKNNIAYLKEYSKNHLGFGTAELFSRLDNAVAKFLGVSPDTLQSGMGAAKTYFYLSRLGLSIPFTITQFIQPAITTPAWHTQLSSEGFKHNPVNTAVMGTVNGVGAAMWHYMKLLGGNTKFVEDLMDGVDKDAVRWMEANGIVEINPLADIKKDLRPEAVKKVSAPFEFTIKHSEVIARSIAFMSFVTHLKQSGVYDLDSAKGRAELFQKAEDMTKISMTDYRPTERAMIFERGGLIGDGAATLHSYQINNLFQLWNFSKEFKNGNPKPLMNMMFMQFLAAGALGLWFIDDLDDLLDQFKKWLPHDDYMYWKDKSIKNFILQNSNDFVAYGAVSALTGTNMHTRMSAADQIPVWPFEPADLTSAKGVGKSILDMAGNTFPFAGTVGNTLAAPIQAVRNIPTRDKLEAAYAGAPAVAQGPMENLPAYNIGNKSRNPTDFSRPPIRRTQEEKNLRNLGLRSTREQRLKDKDYMNSKVERDMQRRMQIAHERAVSYILDGDVKKGLGEAIKYTELGGDVATVLQSIPKARIREVSTELERRALEAGSGTKASILKLKRYLDNVEK